MNKAKTGAVIAAAGLSSRMGAFKPLLPFGSGTVAGCIIQNLKTAGVEPVIVVTGFHGRELEEHLMPLGVEFVHNPDYENTQMLDSVKLGIKSIIGRCDRILIMPADMPAISAATFASVMDADGQVVRANCDGRAAHPLVIDGTIAEMVLDYLGDGGLKAAIEFLGVSITDVGVDDEGVLKDADTPEQYLKLLASKTFPRRSG